MSNYDYNTETKSEENLRYEKMLTRSLANLNKIRHDITNFKKLSCEQLNTVFELYDKDKNDIIILYNDIIESLQLLIGNL